MPIRETLSLIASVAQRKGLSTPFIVGGVPRDKFMGRLENIEDIDLTTGNNDIHALAKEVAAVLPGSSYRVMDDGHASISAPECKLDFSSNFLIPNVDVLLRGAGVAEPKQIQCELYSRDFTCNTLLLTLDLKKIMDPTGLAIQDINRRVLRTCLPAAITLGLQHKRVVRVLYMAAKLDFEVDPEIIKWVKENPTSLTDGAKPKSIAQKLQAAMDANPQRTVKLIGEMGLWQHVPPLPSLIPYMNSPERM